MKLVCISDTHRRLPEVVIPEGDILIHAGDHTNNGTKPELETAIIELGKHKSKFKHIITVFGNHDRFAERQLEYMSQFCFEQGITLLHDSEVIIDGVKFYGAPWTPVFGSWAFMLDAPRRKQKWDLIPLDTDVLIMHGPIYGFGDKLDHTGSVPGANVGCMELLLAVDRVKPKLFIHGHIHNQYGEHEYLNTKIINASTCNEQYRPVNAPILTTI